MKLDIITIQGQVSFVSKISMRVVVAIGEENEEYEADEHCRGKISHSVYLATGARSWKFVTESGFRGLLWNGSRIDSRNGGQQNEGRHA